MICMWCVVFLCLVFCVISLVSRSWGMLCRLVCFVNVIMVLCF